MNEATGRYDLFVSYHWRDHGAVEAVARTLRDRGLRVFLDRWYLTPGQSWPQALERVLENCDAVAVFLGPEGMGSWQQREQDLALDRKSRQQGFPVIPVLLPGSDPPLGFLKLQTWVDLRDGVDDALQLTVLEKSIRGEPPGPDLQERIDANLAGICPYRGLNPFREEDAAFFCGREAFTRKLIEAVDGRNLVAVVGPSGSGKSSVVRAGLVPHLRAGKGAGVWDVATLVPGDRPLHSLAAAVLPLLEPDLGELDRLRQIGDLAKDLEQEKLALRDVIGRGLEKQPGTDSLLLFVDQWEELYTLCKVRAPRQRFLAEILDTALNSPVTVVLTMRGDFYGRALDDRDFADSLQDAVVNLGPMNRDELERSMTAPAEQVGLAFESGLVERILNDVGEEPGSLPLLEFVLTSLWEQRRGGTLHHDAYEAIGGIEGAIAERADRIYDNLGEPEREAARRVLIQMVRPGEGTEDTRQRTALPASDEAAMSVVRALADARLVVTGRDESSGLETVEVTHEALIRNWKELRNWIDADREFLRTRTRVEDAAARWQEENRDQTLLLPPGRPLAEGEELLSDRGAELAPLTTDFISASISAQQAREEATRKIERRRLQRTRIAAAVMAVLAVVAVIGGYVAYDRSVEAERQQAEAEVQKMIAQKEGARAIRTQFLLLADQSRQETAAGDTTTGVLLALETLPKEMNNLDSPYVAQAKTLLYSALHAHREFAILGGHEREVSHAAFSPNGSRIVTASYDLTARVWETAGGKEMAVLSGHTKPVNHATFSPDGSRILTASYDNTARLWDAASGTQIAVLNGHEAAVSHAAFSPDGSRIVTASYDQTARLWEAAGGTQIAILRGHDDWVKHVAFSPNGNRILTASYDRTARLWETADGGEIAVLTGHGDEVLHAAFSHDGSRILTASYDRTARLWEAADGTQIAVLSGHSDRVNHAAFSPDGSRVVTASDDYTARLWETASGNEISVLSGHEAVVTHAAFHPDGSRILTASSDNTARLWEAAGGRQIAVLSGHNAAFSPDGSRVVTASDDNTARLWAAAGTVLTGHNNAVDHAAFSPDGNRILTASYDNTARLWAADVGKEMAVLSGHEAAVDHAAFSPDGSRILTASADKTARLWDANGEEIAVLSHKRPVKHAAFSPNGSLLVTASYDNTARLWDAAGGKEMTVLSGHEGPVLHADFSPNGRHILTASEDNTARLWDVDSGKETAILHGHEEPVLHAAFSTDGSRVLTASKDNTARLWEAASGKQIAVLAGHEDGVLHAAFSPDDSLIVTASYDYTARLWEAASGTQIAVLAGHEAAVDHADFSDDGSRIVTASSDNTARVWEAAGGKLIAVLTGHESTVRHAAFSPDGSRIVTSSQDNTARLFRIFATTQELIERANSVLPRRLTPEERERFYLSPD